MSVLNRKFPDYSVIAYRFVPTFLKKNAFSDLTPLQKTHRHSDLYPSKKQLFAKENPDFRLNSEEYHL